LPVLSYLPVENIACHVTWRVNFQSVKTKFTVHS
jgi:hypothetical protein